MLAILDTIIPLLIFAAFALVSYFMKKKAQREQEEDPPPFVPKRHGAPPEPRRKTWEEELRELLEQNRPAPPPVIREAPPMRPVFVPEPPPEPAIEPHFRPLAGLNESLRRYEEATELHHRVEKHIHDATHRSAAMAAASAYTRQREVSPDARNAVAMIRNPQTVRSAVIVSLILHPPKAFAE